jgi:nucleoid-associated protein YejK
LADYAKYLDILDFEGAEKIIKISSFFDWRNLTELTCEKHLKIIEKITGKTVADYFVDFQRQNHIMNGVWFLPIGSRVIKGQGSEKLTAPVLLGS